jgi:hypothetical protein
MDPAGGTLGTMNRLRAIKRRIEASRSPVVAVAWFICFYLIGGLLAAAVITVLMPFLMIRSLWDR